MANKYTVKPPPEKAIIESLYNDDMKTQKEIGVIFNVSQKVVFSWFKKLSIKSRVAFKRNQNGENNNSWKGSAATYSALHFRVEKARGKPKICQACGTMDVQKIYEWANLTGKYDDTSDYMRMCRSCHRQYDKHRKNSSKHVTRNAK